MLLTETVLLAKSQKKRCHPHQEPSDSMWCVPSLSGSGGMTRWSSMHQGSPIVPVRTTIELGLARDRLRLLDERALHTGVLHHLEVARLRRIDEFDHYTVADAFYV